MRSSIQPQPRAFPAVTTHNPGNHTVRTAGWRYIRYADGAEELYDEIADPREWHNLAADGAYAERKAELARWLPTTNKPLVPNSRHRTLEYRNGVSGKGPCLV